MSGTIPPLPNTSPWRGSQLKHRNKFTFTFIGDSSKSVILCWIRRLCAVNGKRTVQSAVTYFQLLSQYSPGVSKENDMHLSRCPGISAIPDELFVHVNRTRKVSFRVCSEKSTKTVLVYVNQYADERNFGLSINKYCLYNNTI
jgi:hypothetical protein